MKYGVGIDISKGKSTISIMKNDGEVIESSFEINHDIDGLDLLVKKLENIPKEDLKIVMEETGTYHLPVLYYLIDKGYFVIAENALKIKKYLDRGLRKAKTDKKDALKLAEYCCDNWFKLKRYLANIDVNFEEIIVISTEKNYNIDYLLKRIKFFQTSKNVYVVGHTNAGKSSLINKLIKNYSNNPQELTMSPLPSTTLNMVNIEINNHLNLIDTPGLVDAGSILNHVSPEMVKKISAKKEIKPRTYQLRKNQSIIIEDLVRIDYVEGDRNSFTVFISNDLKVRRLLNLFNNEELKDKNKITYNMKYDEDLAISGLGFIKIVDKGVIDVYIDKDVDTFTRKSLI